MDSDARTRVTALVSTLGGDEGAAPLGVDQGADPSPAEALMSLVYPDLRRLARHYLAGERTDHTLQPTAVVHEAYLRLVDDRRVDWRGKTHFFAVSARAMRRILVDYARARRRAKRGGEHRRVTLVDDARAPRLAGLDMEELLTLEGALERLTELDPRQARVLELRFFGGLTVAEVAEVLGVSKRTVEGDWSHAKVWMQRELERGQGR